MADDRFTTEESRKLAVLVARAWGDPQLAAEYKRDPKAVLSGAGIKLSGRAAPELPEKPAELEMQPMVSSSESSSISSASTVTCPCSACTASCACQAVEQELKPQLEAMMKLAEDPEARASARELMASWDIKLSL
jgi:hypothetical protein